MDMRPLALWLAVPFFGWCLIYALLWQFSPKFRDNQYRKTEMRLRSSPRLRVITRCRKLVLPGSIVMFAMITLLAFVSDGFVDFKADESDRWATPYLGIVLVCGLVMGFPFVGNYLFNWPKFFVPKEYRADKGAFGSAMSDAREADILCAEASQAIRDDLQGQTRADSE